MSDYPARFRLQVELPAGISYEEATGYALTVVRKLVLPVEILESHVLNGGAFVKTGEVAAPTVVKRKVSHG